MSSRDQRISDFKALVNSHVADLRNYAKQSWRAMNFNQGEVAIVKSYLEDDDVGPHYLNQHIPQLFAAHGYVVKFASILVHQKPMVRGILKLKPSKERLSHNCELGDLHIIFAYLDSEKMLVECRSIIFQAKKEPANGEKLISNEAQRRLYDECLGFDYHNFANGEQRILPPASTAARRRCLQYLFCGSLPVTVWMPPASRARGSQARFEEMLVRLMNDSAGGVVASKEKNGKSWSRINWDLMNSVKAVASKADPRGHAIEDIIGYFNDFSEHRIRFRKLPEGPSGIPTMFIIVHDKELKPFGSQDIREDFDS